MTKKILWITSQELPVISNDLHTPIYSTGGWVTNMLSILKHESQIVLGVAMVSKKVDSLWIKQIENIIYYVAPEQKKKDISLKDRDKILSLFQPDIIHIEGNEFPIQNTFINTKYKTLLSLQGILSGCAPFQFGCLQIENDLLNPFSCNFFASWILFLKKQLLFKKRIQLETKSISQSRYITGRTFWDRAHSYWINPQAKYFRCNRILRSSFYHEEWNLENCNKHTIFMGNGYSPLKGLHFVIDAINLLQQEYPDIQLYVAGINPIIRSGINIKKYAYGSIIQRKIHKYKLQNKIHFLGHLHEKEMLESMKQSHVYVLSSLIENSPNTLGEAMLLGMPCIASYVGGAPEMAIDEKECLFYRANDPYLLAWQIKRIFENPNLSKKLGCAAKQHAKITHNPIDNKTALLKIYDDILQDKK